MTGLETDRLKFRKWNESDYEPIRKFYSDEINARFVGGLKADEDTWRLMATYLGHYELKGYSYLAIEDKFSGRLIGTVGIWNSEPWPEPELGYWLLPEAQGRGYGVEAGMKVKEYASGVLKTETLVSYIDPANEPSKILAKRLGATKDGQIELLTFGLHEVYRYW